MSRCRKFRPITVSRKSYGAIVVNVNAGEQRECRTSVSVSFTEFVHSRYECWVLVYINLLDFYGYCWIKGCAAIMLLKVERLVLQCQFLQSLTSPTASIWNIINNSKELWCQLFHKEYGELPSVQLAKGLFKRFNFPSGLLNAHLESVLLFVVGSLLLMIQVIFRTEMWSLLLLKWF